MTCAARPRRAHHSTEKWPSLSLGTGRGAHHSKLDRVGLVVQVQGNAQLFVALRSLSDQESLSDLVHRSVDSLLATWLT